MWNVGTTDRAVRIGAGIAMLALGFGGLVTGIAGLVLKIAGFVPIITGMIGFCPLYPVLRVSTRKAP
jgi:hypothetical protein